MAPPPRLPEPPERVLIVRLDNVGDVVMLGPALRALRRAWPHAHLTLCASMAGASAAPMLAWLDEIVEERAVWQDAAVPPGLPLDPGREQALIDRWRAGRYDAALIFTSWSQSPWPAAYAAYLAGIPVRAGESKEFGGSLLTHVAPPLPDSAHQVDRNLHLLAALGIEPAGTHLELALPDCATAEAASLLEGSGAAPLVVVAPGASCPARRYPLDRARAVVEQLVALGLRVAVVGSSREADLLHDVRHVGGALDLVGRTSLPGLTAVIAAADVVVANDSGPMHLADAFARPQVVLYSGTELESQWEPRRSPRRLLRVPTPCSPCHAFTCPFSMECLDIAPGTVAAAGLDLLARTANGQKLPCAS